MKEDKDPKQAGLHTDAKVKKGRVHMHVGKPAEHVFPKALRALAGWAPKAEHEIREARRKAGRIGA